VGGSIQLLQTLKELEKEEYKERYHNCIIGEGVFDILYSIDGEGTFLYAENTETLVILERLFKNNHNINIQ